MFSNFRENSDSDEFKARYEDGKFNYGPVWFYPFSARYSIETLTGIKTSKIRKYYTFHPLEFDKIIKYILDSRTCQSSIIISEYLIIFKNISERP